MNIFGRHEASLHMRQWEAQQVDVTSTVLLSISSQTIDCRDSAFYRKTVTENQSTP